MWQQIRIQTSADGSAALEQLLFEHGTLSVTCLDSEDQLIVHQPVLQKGSGQKEPDATPLWDRITLLGLFDATVDLKNLLALLRFHPAVLNRDSFTVESIADQVWERSWMADFDAMQFGDRLWICPSWQTPPDPDAVNIKLDPGLAFGSGTHATTALCLRWLADKDIEGREVIDYGSGSGVLGIAAALLGVSTPSTS